MWKDDRGPQFKFKFVVSFYKLLGTESKPFHSLPPTDRWAD